MPTASLGIFIRSSTLHYSQTTKAVIILVVLAIRLRRSASCSYKTLPVAASSNMALRAEIASARLGKSRTAARNAAAICKKARFISFTPE